MRKFIASLVLVATSMFGLVTCAPATPAVAAPVNDCSQPTFFAKRVCIDPSVGPYGPILSVYNNNVLVEAHTLNPLCTITPYPTLPAYAYPATMTPIFTGYLSPGGIYTGYATTFPSPVPCTQGAALFYPTNPAVIPGLNQKLLMGGYTFVMVGL